MEGSELQGVLSEAQAACEELAGLQVGGPWQGQDCPAWPYLPC